MTAVVKAVSCCGDPSYPQPYSDPSGFCLVDFLYQDNDWHLLNFQLPVMKPTRISPRPDERDTVIDLAICNNFDMVQDFQVDDYHIQLTTSSTNVVATPQRLIWRTSSKHALGYLPVPSHPLTCSMA